MTKIALLRWSPLVGLLIGTVLAIWLALYVERENETKLQESFDLVSQRAAAQLKRRLELYEYGLRGVRGALIARGQEGISREVFKAYSNSRDYEREFPGARGFGFIRRVPSETEAVFLSAARADGWPGFSIRQLTPHTGERFVIQYIEPVEGNSPAVGLDIASEANRRSAAMNALATGKASITDPITLVQVDGRKNQGFLVLLPVYREGAPVAGHSDRLSAGYGWVYTPLFIEEVLQGFDLYDGRIAMGLGALNEGGTVQIFFTSDGLSEAEPPLRQRVVDIDIFGKTWQMRLQAKPALEQQLNLTSPWLAFAIVLLFTGAGTAATFAMQTANARAQRAEMDARLHETNNRYRQLIDGVKDYAIVQLDTEGRVTGWNLGAERIKGYTAPEILGQHMSAFYPPEEEVSPEQRLAAAREQGLAHEEGWRVRKDGSRYWASVTLTPMYDDVGRLRGYSKIARDLTERREQELELNRLLGLQNAILKSAGVAIIATAMDGKITLFNPSAERLLGYRADEVIGKLTPAAYHDRNEVAERAHVLSRELGTTIKPGLAALGARAMRGEVDTNEWTYITKDGQRKPVLLSVTGIFDEQGVPLGSLGLAADLSEQKRHQRELEAAREAAESANLAKGSFVANMSHEIRTPMNAILGMTQLVLQGDLKPQQRELLEKAFAASKSLLQILNDILDYSKVEAGHMQLEQRELVLEKVLASTAALFAHQAEQKGLELVLDIPAGLPALVIGDPLRLSQVLSNLLSNALKFTPRGTVTLGARLLHRSAAACRVRFFVSDTGIGMGAAEQEQLFRPFNQADASITRRFGGTGLGLSICKRFVELMGSSIEVRSEPGAGSEFTFDIDLPMALGSENGPVPEPRLPFARALVVDDHLASAQVIQPLLQAWGIKSQCANSASEALQMMQTAQAGGHPFDLVLTDWKMPGMDGVELANAIEQMPPRADGQPAATVLMVTAYQRDVLESDIHGHHSIAAVLAKPVAPSMLFDALSALRPTRAGRSPGPSSTSEPLRNYVERAAPLRGAHVLLAEDNEVNQQVATAFLHAAGLQVSLAANGRQAVQLATATPFAAILMDLHMPVMDGLEAARHIRANPDCAAVPIVAMTAAVTQEDQRACREAGMNGFVGKPFDPEELVAELLRWIDKPAHGTPSARGADSSGATQPQPLTRLQGLEGLDGLDLRAAVARMGGDTALCARLLGDFAQHADERVAELQSAGQEHLPALLHRLKGEASNLGLWQVAQGCAGAEAALKAPGAVRPTLLLSELCEKIRAIALKIVQTQNADLANVDVENAPVVSTNDWPPQQLDKLLERLKPQLEEQRMQAVQTSNEIRDLLQRSPAGLRYQALHRLILELQFAAANEALPTFRAQLADRKGP